MKNFYCNLNKNSTKVITRKKPPTPSQRKANYKIKRSKTNQKNSQLEQQQHVDPKQAKNNKQHTNRQQQPNQLKKIRQ